MHDLIREGKKNNSDKVSLEVSWEVSELIK